MAFKDPSIALLVAAEPPKQTWTFICVCLHNLHTTPHASQT
jgi:hypothetical protein